MASKTNQTKQSKQSSDLIFCSVTSSEGQPVSMQAVADEVARLVNPTEPMAQADQPELGLWLLNFPAQLIRKLRRNGLIEISVCGYTITAEVP